MKNTLNGEKFATIEAGRGIAACLVVFHHAGNIIALPRNYGVHPFAGHLQNFNVGVDFFFVLSGFIIAWVHWADLGNPRTLPVYAWKRFVRIFPTYWAVLTPLVTLYLLFPSAGIDSQRDVTNVIASFLLFPFPMPPVLGVAWTLTHELFFYLLFSVCIVFGRLGLILFLAWAALIVFGHYSIGDRFPLSFFLNPFNLEFIMGLSVAVALKFWRPHVIFSKLCMVFGAGSFLFLLLFALEIQEDSLVGRTAFGLSAALFLFGSVAFERTNAICIPRPLIILGASSYAIYLIHPLVLSFSMRVIDFFGLSILGLGQACLFIALVSIAVGVAFHFSIEKPILSMLRLRSSNRGEALSPTKVTTGSG